MTIWMTTFTNNQIIRAIIRESIIRTDFLFKLNVT